MEEESDNEAPSISSAGATTDLPHDRITVQRFREAFPRARWSDNLNAWFVPGRTAERRIGRWLAEMEAEAEVFADEKGRDAFAFNPIESPYLEAGQSSIQIQTPYSRTVVNEIREIPFARWNADRRLWTLPYRSFEELRWRWPAIEAAAERNEPDMRKARRETLKGTKEEEASMARTRERRRKRYPIPADDGPPLERAIGTHAGVVFFTGTDGELADAPTMDAFYFSVRHEREYVWTSWRPGSLEELVATWPTRTSPGESELGRGWWLPTLKELRDARKNARSRRQAKQHRQKGASSSERAAESP